MNDMWQKGIAREKKSFGSLPIRECMFDSRHIVWNDIQIIITTIGKDYKKRGNKYIYNLVFHIQ